MKLIKYLTIAGLLSASLSAHAAVYEFSYNFNGGDWNVSGTFNGNANGDLISIAEFETLAYTSRHDGSATFTKDSLPGLAPAESGMYTSFSGTSQNFHVQSNYSSAKLVVDAKDKSISSFLFLQSYPSSAVNDSVINSSWRVTAAVPEPTTYGMLLVGLAGIGFVARRKWAD